MAEHETGTGPSDVTRRGLLAAAGAAALAAATGPAAGAQGKEKGKAERTFEGESKRGSLQEALERALAQLDRALGEGGVADAMAEWKLAGVTGRRGGIAGFNTVKVTITATRGPEWGKE